MEIKVSDIDKETLKKDGYGKFVLIKSDRDEVLHLFISSCRHVEYKPSNPSDFIGAGFFALHTLKDTKVDWDSDTFKKDKNFGRFKPKDEAEAAETMERIRGEISKWACSIKYFK